MTSTQLAVIFPAVLVWLLLIVQYGLWWHAKQVVDAAAGQATDAAKTSDGSAAAGERAARDLLDAAGNVRDVVVTVDRRAGTVDAQIRGRAVRLVPWLDWTVAAQSHAPVERFVPEPQR